ncbi:MAG: SpaA isopeptide-forming pilin-related protein, partial [Oscillospiraceae bacterium]|nr:SpaA isopeptide-forming pilin-related protein [Oscillospiraceae bacterium]
DSEGKAELKNLLPGVYEISEKSVPSPYLLDAPSQLATLYPNRDHTVYFENHQKPSLTVKKVDSVTGDPLQGAKFQVIYASNNTSSGEINDLGTFYTDENGQFQLTGLRDGWYKVTEQEPPTGYAIKEATQEVYIQSGTSKVLTLENIPLSALIVWKYDSVTGEAVSNAVFQVKYLTGTSGTGGTVIGTYKTSANGSFTVTGLKEGTYIVEELASDSGHVIDTAPQTAYISGKQQDVVQLYFGNSPKGGLLVKKIDSATHNPLSDVEFLVTTADGTVVGDANGKFVTDSAGSFTVSGINPGTTLVVKETRAKAGYVLDDTPQTATIKAGQTVTLEFRNAPQGNLIINKLDSVTKKPLEGVRFKITYADGSFVDNGVLSSKGIYFTDRSGQIILSGITGTVIVTEEETIKGYRIDDAFRSQTIEVRTNDTQQLWFYNTPVSGILIHKISSVDGKAIPGVTFLLYDSTNTPVAQATSDDHGYAWFEDLPAGRYFLREMENEGYVRDTQKKTVYVKPGETTEVEWENTPITGQIQITKRSADYNSTNGLPAGALLEGAVFEITDKAGNVVDTIRSNSRGLAISKQLPLSRYFVREVKAPEHYGISEKELTVYLEYEGQIARLEVEDKSLSTGVSITKTGPKEIMANQPVRFAFSQIANTSNVSLSNFYWRDTLPAQVRLEKVVTGTYNFPGTYKIVYRVNGGDYRTLADNLSTGKNYTLAASSVALGLAANEHVTEVMFVFGQAPAGFAQVESPYLYCKAVAGLPAGSFVNVADVGGTYNGTWVQAVSRWVISVYGKPTVPKLPRTGY